MAASGEGSLSAQWEYDLISSSQGRRGSLRPLPSPQCTHSVDRKQQCGSYSPSTASALSSMNFLSVRLNFLLRHRTETDSSILRGNWSRAVPALLWSSSHQAITNTLTQTNLKY
ncbi:hypothetical protein INR49_014175 [Caranx melampygus]|nr:hypothetical protein INR49_014175 [Caranx melampygus]